jgi:RNA polymerase sigma factor, sigma-70 family
MTPSKLNYEQQQLVEQHLYLVPIVIKSNFFISKTNVEMNHDDLTQMGNLALCKAALRYDKKRAFPPFAKTVIRNALFDYARRLKLQSQKFCYLSEEVISSLSYSYEYPEIESYLKLLEKNATGTHQKGLYAIRMKSAGFRLVDIAKDLGVTTTTIRSWINHSKKELYNNSSFQNLVS